MIMMNDDNEENSNEMIMVLMKWKMVLINDESNEQ